jgi:DNA-3-methyladenine glycosylase I
MPITSSTPTSLAGYLETMSRAVFSAGMSGKVIDAKWDGTVAAFDGFDPETVAAYTPDDIERLMADTRIVRNRKKVEGTIHNAGELLVVDREFGSVEKYLASFENSDLLVKNLHKRFKFLGESVARMFLYGVAFDVAAQEVWAREHFGEAKMREHGG